MHKLLVLYNGPKDPTHFRKILRREALAAEQNTGPQGKSL